MEINLIAVGVAAVAGWLVGAAWYGLLSKQYMAALGKTEAEIAATSAARRMPIGPMIIAIVAQLVMAAMLAGIVAHLGGPNLTVGIVSGILIWIGFVATTLVVNYAFQQRKLALTLIDGGHWLLVLIVQGAVLGLFG